MIEAFEGKRPAAGSVRGSRRAGSRPTFSPARLLYLLDWCIDDQPVWLSTRDGGRILAVPYPRGEQHPVDHRPEDSAEQFPDMIVDNFDDARAGHRHAAGDRHSRFIPISSVSRTRLRHLRRALRRVADNQNRIPVTTAGAIASHLVLLDHRE